MRRFVTAAVMAISCFAVLPPKMYPASRPKAWLPASPRLASTSVSATT